jgi:7,8-dihydropterin-6-yl-methyl-4-(beta-D-ribofuranosyl)aminobenzene 5'-phosphate synthase
MFPWFTSSFGQRKSLRSQAPIRKGRDVVRCARPLKGFLSIGAFLVGWSMVMPIAVPEQRFAMPPTTAHGISIATVFDNYAADPRLTTSWGFAAAVIAADTAVLFDTGADGSILLANMTRIKLDPKAIQAVVISHIHQDHLGGLEGFLAANGDVTVYIPAAFPDSVRRMIRATGAGLRDVTRPTDLAPDIFTIGPLGNGLDEQALVVETEEGLVIITGCAHPGIVRIVEAAHAHRSGQPIALVMGGFHLKSASASEIARIIQAFRRLGVKKVAPSHCTGDAARSHFREAYGADFVEGGVGLVLSFNRVKAETSR